MHNADTVREILETLSQAGVPDTQSPAVLNRILDIAMRSNLDLSQRVPSDIEVATFVSSFDDGSEFRSACLVDTARRRVISVASAGCASDGAACIEQRIVFADDATAPVNDPDLDAEHDGGYDLP